jgi:hypothetical protein
LRVVEYRDDAGLRYFEISSGWSRLLAFCAIRAIPAVVVTKPLRHFAFSNQDVFCEFAVDGIAFEIEEPWGDSSVFEVAPVERSPAASAVLEGIARSFQTYTPWPLSLWRR